MLATGCQAIQMSTCGDVGVGWTVGSRCDQELVISVRWRVAIIV
jgi:hypothetical protein